MYRKSKSISLKKNLHSFYYFIFYLVKVSPIARVTSSSAFRDRSTKCKAVLYPYETPAQTITLPPPQRSTSCMQQATYRSPVRLHTRIRPSTWDRIKRDSSENRTSCHRWRVQGKCPLDHSNRWRRWRWVSIGPLNGRPARRPFSLRRRRTV